MIGFGSLPRKEDARFIRGQGRYLDDVQLPGPAARRDPALAGAARRDRLDRRLRGAPAPEGPRGADRRRPRRDGVDADDVGRPAGGAGHRPGALPGPGGRVRDRRRSLLGARRAGADRRLLRPAAGGRRSARGVAARRAAGARRRQSRLRLGGRRRGGDGGRVRARRRGDRAGDALPARASGAARDLRRGGGLRPRQRQAHGLVHDPGAARAPHAVLAHHRPAGAQDPRDLAGRRRRVRQQGPDLPRLPVRGRGRAEPRPAGEVGRGPVREPDVDRVRARLRDERSSRRESRRQDPRRGGRRHRRPRCVQRRRPADDVPGRVLQRLHRLLRRRGRALPGHRRVHEQGARRGGVLVLVPDRRGRLSDRAHRGLPGARAGDRSGRAPAAKPPACGPVPVPEQDRLGVRLGRLRADAAAARWNWRATRNCDANRRSGASGAS